LTPKLQNLILQTVMKSLKLLSVILAGFWIGACVTTSSNRKTAPPSTTPRQTQTESSQTQPAPEQSPSSQQSTQGTSPTRQGQTSEPSQASPPASKETSRDTQQQTSESSQSGPNTSQENGKDQQQQDSDKSESGQTAAGSTKMPDSRTAREASDGAAGTQSEVSEERAGRSQPAAAGTADSKLEEARRNLRISEATEKRIAAELEQLRRSGTASPETIKNYDAYHDSVKEMVVENRKIVEQMEAARARHSGGATSSEAAGGMHDPRIPEEETTGEVAALDRQLNASLNQFDAKLLKEMDDIRNGSAEKMRDLAQEAAEAARRLRENGVDVNTSGSESSEGAEEAAARDREQKQTEQGAEGSTSASTDSSRPGGKGAGGAEQDRASTEDDDIVARQLREAAENETDPELKEKLWKEYDEYKKNQR
jgi:hypothetical protein